jgi:aspartate/methionine/tyrosine aminotransferase
MWINYPHMPTGKTAKREDFQGIIQFARENGILICHDNPYSLILNPEKPQSILAIDGAAENCLELNSLSKSHNMAGWRVGMVCGKREYIDAVQIVKSNMDSGMFLPVQRAAAQALQNSEAWHAEQNRRYRRRRELVYQLMDTINLSYKTGGAGMFVWAKLPDSVPDAESFVDELLYSRGIFVAPGSIFGKNGNRYIRVSVCAPEENIQKAKDRVLTIP